MQLNATKKLALLSMQTKKNERKVKKEIWTALNMTIDKSKWQDLQAKKETEVS